MGSFFLIFKNPKWIVSSDKYKNQSTIRTKPTSKPNGYKIDPTHIKWFENVGPGLAHFNSTRPHQSFSDPRGTRSSSRDLFSCFPFSAQSRFACYLFSATKHRLSQRERKYVSANSYKFRWHSGGFIRWQVPVNLQKLLETLQVSPF